MEINIWDYLTFRKIILAVFCLPLVTMLLTMPFLGLIPKGVKTGINFFGYFGGVAGSVVAVELVYRTIGSIIDYKYQKPQIVFDKTIKQRYEPFDSEPLIYLIVFIVLAAASYVVADIYSNKIKYGRIKKPYSEKNPLDLNG